MSQLRSDATQAIAPVIQRWASLNDYAALEASGEVLDEVLGYLGAHIEEWIASTIYAAGGHYDLEDVKVLLAALRVGP